MSLRYSLVVVLVPSFKETEMWCPSQLSKLDAEHGGLLIYVDMKNALTKTKTSGKISKLSIQVNPRNQCSHSSTATLYPSCFL